jgi:hypothetical protein
MILQFFQSCRHKSIFNSGLFSSLPKLSLGKINPIALFFPIILSFCLFCLGGLPAWAGMNDDKFEGNIFALYAGNGSLVPARGTLAESLQNHKPALLVFYIDDSKDCKQFATVVSSLQAIYGRVADFIPVAVDAIPRQPSYQPTEVGYYYQGLVPQMVLFDQAGKVVLNAPGQLSFEKADDVLRQVFNREPRPEAPDLKQRSINEFNSELAQ